MFLCMMKHNKNLCSSAIRQACAWGLGWRLLGCVASTVCTDVQAAKVVCRCRISAQLGGLGMELSFTHNRAAHACYAFPLTTAAG
jgi:hypothetical protein